MSFRFRIHSITYLPTADVYALDGTLESGTVMAGSEGVVREPGKSIKVKSVALVNSRNVGSNRLTLSVERPAFALSEVSEGMILDG